MYRTRTPANIRDLSCMNEYKMKGGGGGLSPLRKSVEKRGDKVAAGELFSRHSYNPKSIF